MELFQSDGGTGTFESASANYKDINFNQEFSSSLAAGDLVKINVLASDLTNADLKAVRSFEYKLYWFS